MNSCNDKTIKLEDEILEFIAERYFNNESLKQIFKELEEFKKTNGNKVSINSKNGERKLW